MQPFITYSSYQEALKDSSQDAYQNQELVEVIFQKTLSCIQAMETGHYAVDVPSAFSTVALCNALTSNMSITVIDIGGACGLHYFSARLILPPHIKLSWRVVETTAMANKAKELESNELKFFDDIDAAAQDLGKVDLIFTSGALQYMPDPYWMIDKILSIGAKHILFTRCNFIQKPNDLIINHPSMLSFNGKGPLPEGFVDKEIRYPCTILSLDRFLNTVNKSYDLALQIEDQSGTFEVNNEPTFGTGLLFQLK